MGKGALWTLGLVTIMMAGVVLGLGGYTFYRAKGHSYFSDAPEACVNCHVMREQYESWRHSSHRNWAVCNDCHMPHDTVVNKYYTKALNGWLHSVKFTTGNFPEPIVIGARNRRIALDNCLYCHGPLVRDMLINADRHNPDDLACISCHGNVGHQGTK